MFFYLMSALLLFILFAALIGVAIEYLSRCKRLTILDMQKMIRPTSASEIMKAFHPQTDLTMRSVFSRTEHRESQRRRLFEAQEYLGRMAHNAVIFLIWANTEVWRETRYKPGMEGAAEFMELGNNLATAATQFRIYAFLTLLRIKYWLVLRTQWWFPFPAPEISDLRELGGLRFIASYARLREAVGALCLAHGQEFYDEIMPSI